MLSFLFFSRLLGWSFLFELSGLYNMDLSLLAGGTVFDWVDLL